MNKNIRVGSLEFDQIKQNLKTFLSSQSTFSDYNFEGSNLAVLIDLLAYNTYYNNIYNNFGINEVFLDTATKRSSVVSLAKSLGYIPRSAISARGTVNITVNNINILSDYVTLPRLSSFYGIKDGIRYNFFTNSAYTVKKVGTTATFENVEIIEGAFISSRFMVDERNFIHLENTNIDLTTLQVKVQTPPSTENVTFTSALAVTNIDSDSNVYFLREVEGEKYEIYFGDDILGKRLTLGQIVNVYYFRGNAEAPNGISYVQYSGQSISGGSVTSVTFSGPSTGIGINGGRSIETIDEIRFNAPNMYSSQNRAVTATDYETIILNRVPSIKTVSVWGGENNIPPEYGKVFISTKTVTGVPLTYNEQQSIIRNVLNQYKLITVQPVFVNPEFLNVELSVVVYYDSKNTTSNPSDIVTGITSEVLHYDTTELQKFSKIFRSSVISRIAEEVDPSIVSSTLKIRVHRTVTPVYGKAHSYIIDTGNPISKGTVKSNKFRISSFGDFVHLRDDGLGALFIFNDKTKMGSAIGTVDYDGGIFSFNTNIVALDEETFTIGFVPQANDVVSKSNQIVLLDRTKLYVDALEQGSTENFRFVTGRFE